MPSGMPRSSSTSACRLLRLRRCGRRRLVGHAAVEDRREPGGVDVPAGDDADDAARRRRARRAQRRRRAPPAPSATMRARSASRRTAAAVSSSGIANASETSGSCALPHRPGSRPARAGAVDERRRVVDRRRARRPFATAAATGAPVSGSHDDDARRRGRSAASALAIPVVSPPPPHGMRTASISSRSSASSSPMVPLPAMTALVAHGVDEVAVDAVAVARPASIASHQRSHGTRDRSRPPSRSTAASFVCGRVVRGDDRRGHAELARHPGDALRHVPRARRRRRRAASSSGGALQHRVRRRRGS